jgi:hypothetical protein
VHEGPREATIRALAHNGGARRLVRLGHFRKPVAD